MADPVERPEQHLVATVRVAHGRDHRALAALRWRWRVEEAGEQPAAPFDEFAADFGRWADGHADSHIAYVAALPSAAGPQLIGMGWLAVLERVPGPGVWDRRSGFVQSVYVEPEHRGHGVGLALTQALLAEARARGLAYVSVHPSERSFPLYRRAGFADTDRVLQLRF